MITPTTPNKKAPDRKQNVPVAVAIKVTLVLFYDEVPKAALGSK